MDLEGGVRGLFYYTSLLRNCNVAIRNKSVDEDLRRIVSTCSFNV
jgi:hypothetical protein